MNSPTENQIIARVKNGNHQDFEHLVLAYQGAVFRIVGNLVSRSHQLEDLVQDVFLAAFANIRRFDPGKGNFRTWLYAIARNKAINARRKHREVEMPDGLEIQDERTAIDDLVVKEAFAQLDNVLAGLKFQERLIFIMADLEGLPYDDIASIENIPLGTVKSRLSRVRRKLRRALRPECSQPDHRPQNLEN